MKDIQFTQPKTILLKPRVLGKSTVKGLLLYQKIVVLLLSSQIGAYRQQAGTNLIDLLNGANTPSDTVLASLGTMACNQVKGQLDDQDAQAIDSLTATAQNGLLTVTLTLDQNESYSGALI